MQFSTKNYFCKLELKQECSAFAYFTLHLYVAFMKHHNLFAKAKTDAAACFLGAKEWNKNFVEQFFGHACAIVGDLYDCFVVLCIVCGK